jgi:hypothetical protein
MKGLPSLSAGTQFLTGGQFSTRKPIREKVWKGRLAMRKQREFIRDWLAKTFEVGAIAKVDWANDSRCTITDTAGDTMRVWFLGRTLMADNRVVGRMQSPRERMYRH